MDWAKPNFYLFKSAVKAVHDLVLFIEHYLLCIYAVDGALSVLRHFIIGSGSISLVTTLHFVDGTAASVETL